MIGGIQGQNSDCMFQEYFCSVWRRVNDTSTLLILCLFKQYKNITFLKAFHQTNLLLREDYPILSLIFSYQQFVLSTFSYYQCNFALNKKCWAQKQAFFIYTFYYILINSVYGPPLQRNPFFSKQTITRKICITLKYFSFYYDKLLIDNVQFLPVIIFSKSYHRVQQVRLSKSLLFKKKAKAFQHVPRKSKLFFWNEGRFWNQKSFFESQVPNNQYNQHQQMLKVILIPDDQQKMMNSRELILISSSLIFCQLPYRTWKVIKFIIINICQLMHNKEIKRNDSYKWIIIKFNRLVSSLSEEFFEDKVIAKDCIDILQAHFQYYLLYLVLLLYLNQTILLKLSKPIAHELLCVSNLQTVTYPSYFRLQLEWGYGQCVSFFNEGIYCDKHNFLLIRKIIHQYIFRNIHLIEYIVYLADLNSKRLGILFSLVEGNLHQSFQKLQAYSKISFFKCFQLLGSKFQQFLCYFYLQLRFGSYLLYFVFHDLEYMFTCIWWKYYVLNLMHFEAKFT